MEYEGQHYTIMPGSLVFIHLAKESLIEAPHSPWEIYFLHVYGSDIDDIYRSFVQAHGNYLSNIDERFFVDCVQRVYDNAVNNLDLYYISGQLYLMLMDILKQSEGSRTTELVGRAVAYFNHHFMEEINIEALAADLFVSKSFLIREFHRETGSTPKQYLTNIRLQKARLLLVHTNMTIRKIAEESGFMTEKNIFYAFRSVLNTTPTQFRNYIYASCNPL
jgi:AraC-like DNA-binding protein